MLQEDMETRRLAYQVCSKYGDDFVIELPFNSTTIEGRRAIGEKLPQVELKSLSNGSDFYLCDDDVLDSRYPIVIDYTLRGSGGVQCIKNLPDLCNIKILCFKCGLQNCPDANNSWLCESVFLCLFGKCGFVELKQTQFCCLGPCTKPTLTMTTAIPVSTSR